MGRGAGKPRNVLLGKNLFTSSITREENQTKKSNLSEPNNIEDRFVALVYKYTDRDNFKQVHIEYFKGYMATGDRDRIYDNLDQGEFFIPDLVGLPSFSEGDDERDHPWHTVEEIKNVTKADLMENQPFGYAEWNSFLNAWDNISDWETEFGMN